MSSFPFGVPDQSSFEVGSSPYLESVGNLTDADDADTQNVHYGIVEVVLIEKGTCRLITGDDTVHPLRKGSLVLIGSGILHRFKNRENLNALIIRMGDIHLRGLPAAQLIPEEAPVLISLNTSAAKGMLFPLLQSIKLLALEEEHKYRSEAGAHLARALVLMLIAILDERRNHSAENALHGIGVRIKEYIDAHYLEDLKLTDIASTLHINPYYLSHTFKDLMGVSPMSYIIRRRIDEAQSLLLTTNLTITAIAMECGYNNSNYFQSVFKNIVGMTPGKYRKMWKQDL